MPRAARTLLLPLLLLSIACTTAGSARRAELRRGLDEARVSRSPAELWSDLQRFLHERGYPLVGEDRRAVGLEPQGTVTKLFSPGFETRVRRDGSRVLETNVAEGTRTRLRAEALPAEGGGSRVRLTVLTPVEWSPAAEHRESRDEELELALLERLEPAAAARVAGVSPSKAPAPLPAAAPAATATDAWAPLRPFLGAWSGTLASGAPARWRFDFVAGGRFLDVRGSPLLFAGPTARRDAGEELGRISRDASGERLVWQQFTESGRIDRWVSGPPLDGGVAFVAEASESLPPGTRARITFRREGEDALRAVLELAEAGKDFAAAGEVRLAREP